MMCKSVAEKQHIHTGGIYDRMAPHYRAYAEQKSTYIEAVDHRILNNLPLGAQTMLDVGAGDGVRGLALAKAAGITRLVLAEPSAEMVRLCHRNGATEVWEGTADDLPETHQPPFDVITCLWNVMGHIPNGPARVRALKKMKSLLAPSGKIFMDVNNRHNAHAYGTLTVLGRRVMDRMAPDEKKGDVSFLWKINGEEIPANGHLFTPAEVRELVKQAGLELTQSLAIDYKSGASSTDLTKGQMFFIIEKNDGKTR